MGGAILIGAQGVPKNLLNPEESMNAPESTENRSAAELIDERIADLPDWRGEALSRIRRLIKEAAPDVVEEVKWRKPSNSMSGVPVWSRDGMVCTGELYKDKVKLTFAKGAALEDPAKLFNSSLDGNARRAIDIREGDAISASAFKALVRAAVALNGSAQAQRKSKRPSARRSGG